MKTKNKLGYSPLSASTKEDSEYKFIPNRELGEKVEITTSNLSTENKPFNINEEFSKEKDREQRINSDSFQIDEIPNKVLTTLKSFLKI